MSHGQKTPPSQRQLAEMLGLTQATVSRALRDDRHLKPETRERVLAMAREMGYRLSPLLAAGASRSLSSRRELREADVAVLLDDPNRCGPEKRPAPSAHWIEKAETLGLRLRYINVAEESQSAEALAGRLYNQGVLGVLFGSPWRRPEWLEKFDFSSFAMVNIDSNLEHFPVHTVHTQSRRTMERAVRTAVRRGYARVAAAVWGQNDRNPHYPALLAGFLGGLAMEEQGLDPELFHCLDLSLPPQDRRAGFEAWLDSQCPDAVIVPSAVEATILWERNQAGKSNTGIVQMYKTPASLENAWNRRITGFVSSINQIGDMALELLENAIRYRRYGPLDHARVTTIAPDWHEGETLLGKHRRV